MCINCSFFTFIFAVLLPAMSTYILSFYVITYVKLLEIWVLWHRARWPTREEHLCPSNYNGLDIYFNSLGQICIPTSGLSVTVSGVSVFFGWAFLYNNYYYNRFATPWTLFKATGYQKGKTSGTICKSAPHPRKVTLSSPLALTVLTYSLTEWVIERERERESDVHRPDIVRSHHTHQSDCGSCSRSICPGSPGA